MRCGDFSEGVISTTVIKWRSGNAMAKRVSLAKADSAGTKCV
jgi:hypothetical protein